MSAQKLMYKWWKDNDRYIQDPWAEISLLQEELKQMSITEAALRESLTGLSRESNEYRHKIETENAALRAELDEIKKAFAPTFVNELHVECLKLERENECLADERNCLVSENRKLKFALEEIANLQDRWPNWDYQDLYTVSRDTANNALEAAKNA